MDDCLWQQDPLLALPNQQQEHQWVKVRAMDDCLQQQDPLLALPNQQQEHQWVKVVILHS
jgi:hypothetical protein